ncbi:hypothetical protein B0H67DRAFT_211773 [Lasiosphaeris hirsuta]|uniref:Uncharacterized protein n=1 Tax=Lasiosphaeris hirsuta TaxID=260670 RepID=A0AA40ASC6_9PEZI|nr:hypothetical protein B0H67DRAFT_211773 [Lasiosphaeris hirsuta]
MAQVVIKTEIPKPSDLPLRHYISPTAKANPEVTDLPLPTTPEEETDSSELDTPNSDTLSPQTPSSAGAEFRGNRIKGARPVEVPDDVSQSHSRSRSRSVRNGPGYSSRSNTPRPPNQSRSTSRSQSSQRGERNVKDKAYGEMVSMFSNSITQDPPADPAKELLIENCSLQQRIAALQRVERDMLNENHGLVQQLASFKQHYETRRRQWKNDSREREKAYEARIRELEERVARQDEELLQAGTIRSKSESSMSNTETSAWFTTRTSAWQTWAEDFAHGDSERIQSGLHPLQLSEVCESVKSFVRLTDDGKLPDELTSSPNGENGVKTVHVLLHGMLVHFVISEIFRSPFWVFAALSASGLELESPSVLRANSMSPIGFRMDLAMWNNVAPPRPGSAGLLQPVTARRVPEPGSGRRLPALATAPVPSLSLNTTSLTSASNECTPKESDMVNFYQLLSDVQQNDSDVHIWRSQLIRILNEGGLGLDPADAGGEKRRLLVEVRQSYAKKLKDRFLSGAARFLLADQDTEGIEKLEGRLVQELDMALRFSCQIWSRQDPLKFKSLQDLSTLTFRSSDNTMELCSGQAPVVAGSEEATTESKRPPTYHDGHRVVMVIQPMIESVHVTGGGKKEDHLKGRKDSGKVWVEAQVLVSSPRPEAALSPAPATTPVTSPTSAPSPSPAMTISPSFATLPFRSPMHDPPPVPPKDLPILLPRVAFKASPTSNVNPTRLPGLV